MASLKDVMSPAFDGPCMHEALFDDSFLKDTGVSTLDFAKAMIDEGYHPMTMYFPLVVHGAMLIEPTESQAKEDLDLFIAALRSLAERAKSGTAAEAFKAAPRFAPRRRLDETLGGAQAGAALAALEQPARRRSDEAGGGINRSEGRAMRVFTTLPQENLAKVGPAAQAIEAAGYTGVSTQENKHEPFLSLAVAGAATRRIELHTGVAIAFARSPMAVANVGWDLAASTAAGASRWAWAPRSAPTTSGASPCRGRRRRRACANTCRPCGRSGRRGRATASSTTRASTIASP